MDNPIILECQTKEANITCEDCIVYKQCTTNKRKTANTPKTNLETFMALETPIQM
jgi:hypothetical protein